LAYENYSNTIPSEREFMILKVQTKLKKNGISWIIGELAEFKLKNATHI
jgi:hypothetical protein